MIVRLALLVGLALAGSESASAAPSCIERTHGAITVRGIVRNIGTVQEEPQEQPQTYFTLDPARWRCGRIAIDVHVPGAGLPCAAGDLAKVTGEYLAPGKLLTRPLLDAERDTIVCAPH